MISKLANPSFVDAGAAISVLFKLSQRVSVNCNLEMKIYSGLNRALQISQVFEFQSDSSKKIVAAMQRNV